jgi:hypothetical protein
MIDSSHLDTCSGGFVTCSRRLPVPSQSLPISTSHSVLYSILYSILHSVLYSSDLTRPATIFWAGLCHCVGLSNPGPDDSGVHLKYSFLSDGAFKRMRFVIERVMMTPLNDPNSSGQPSTISPLNQSDHFSRQGGHFS